MIFRGWQACKFGRRREARGWPPRTKNCSIDATCSFCARGDAPIIHPGGRHPGRSPNRCRRPSHGPCIRGPLGKACNLGRHVDEIGGHAAPINPM